jgi:lactam utilization protein B
LVSRKAAGAIIEKPEKVVERTVKEGVVEAVDGSLVSLALCMPSAFTEISQQPRSLLKP